jgi:hypothetical protein
MDHTSGINNLLGQKLIFFVIQKYPRCSLLLANIEKKCDIRDEHTLFYQFVKTVNEKMTKKQF